MTRVPSAVLALVAGSLPVAVPPDSPHTARLVTQLGSEAFAEREAAEKNLEALGAVAVEPLRAACRSPSPEVSRRAGDVLARIERRIANEQALAPTRVRLKAENVALGYVLADLSKQSGYQVVFEGPNAEEIEQDRITVKTGRVPFWQAVVAVCDAGELEIVSVAGFLAPGTRPDPKSAQLAKTVVLGARGLNKPRPAAVYGAVLVEAFPLPDGAAVQDTASVLLHVWSEPKLNWQAAKGVRVRKAADTAGRLLAARPDLGPLPDEVLGKKDVVVARRGWRGAVRPDPAVKAPPAFPRFTPTSRQALVNLKPGAKPSAGLAELAGTVRGTVRSGVEPLVVGALASDRFGPLLQAEAFGRSGCAFRVTVQNAGNRAWLATVGLTFDPSAVIPAVSGYTPATGGGMRAGAAGRPGDRRPGYGRGETDMVCGLRVTDADDKPFTVFPQLVQQQLNRATGRVEGVSLVLRLTPTEQGQAAPKSVTFWGTYPKPVEVPFALKGVPLSGGKK